MNIPHVGQRVWAEKMTGTFTVVAINIDQGHADLQSADGRDTQEKRVPFGVIHAVGGDHSSISGD